MQEYYLVLLVFLGALALFDLFVGVSNDAVNFLNSALGCRIASFRTTMWVAAAGVMLGATFSSGMMEIARSGVFHPQMFSFTEIMLNNPRLKARGFLTRCRLSRNRQGF